MPEAYIVDAVRTPVGRRNGGLSKIHPADLGAHSLSALMDRTGIDPQCGRGRDFRLRRHSLARRLATSPAPAGSPPACPEEVPGTTIDRQCGSSQQAVHFAAQAVMSGTSDVIVAGGVQNMSHDPDLQRHDRLAAAARLQRPVLRFRGLAQALRRRGSLAVPLGRDDRREMAGKREDMEQLRLSTAICRAIAAIDEGRFRSEIAPLNGVENDEGPRRDTSLEKMATLKTADRKAAGHDPASPARSPTPRRLC